MVLKKSSERIIRDIKRQTKRKFSSEEKISIVIEGLRGEDSIASICRDDTSTWRIGAPSAHSHLHLTLPSNILFNNSKWHTNNSSNKRMNCVSFTHMTCFMTKRPGRANTCHATGDPLAQGSFPTSGSSFL